MADQSMTAETEAGKRIYDGYARALEVPGLAPGLRAAIERQQEQIAERFELDHGAKLYVLNGGK